MESGYILNKMMFDPDGQHHICGLPLIATISKSLSASKVRQLTLTHFDRLTSKTDRCCIALRELNMFSKFVWLTHLPGILYVDLVTCMFDLLYLKWRHMLHLL